MNLKRKSKPVKYLKNIYECLAILSTIQFVFGTLSFRKVRMKFVTSALTTIYTQTIQIIAIAGIIIGIYWKISSPEHSTILRQISPLVLFIGAMEIVVSMISFLITTTSLHIYRRQHIQLLDRLDAVDRQLISEFNVNMNYHKMVRKNVGVVTILMSYYILSTMSLLIQLAENDYLNMLNIAIWYTIITVGPHSCSYGHMNSADLIRIRFRLLQKLMKPEFLLKRYADSRIRTSKLKCLVGVYKELFGIIEMLNLVYGPSLLSILLHDFTLTTSEFYILLWKTADSDSNVILAVLFFMISPVYKIVCSPLYTHFSIVEVSIAFLRKLKKSSCLSRTVQAVSVPD